MNSNFGEIIYTYTTKQAISDGVLVEIEEAKDYGFSMPVLVTSSVWEAYIKWSDEDSDRQVYQDQSGRLHDIFTMLNYAIKLSKEDTNRLLFKLYAIPRDRASKRRLPKEVVLKAVVGAYDFNDPKPAITIMQRDED